MGRARGPMGLVMVVALVVALAPVGAGAADRPRPARYVDGTITTWDSRTGATRWTAEPDDGRYLEVRAAGRTLVVGQTGRCTDDGLVAERAVAFDARTGEERWRAEAKGPVLDSGTGSGIVVVLPGFDRLAGLSARSGKRKWKLDGELMGANASTVFMHADAYSPTVEARDRATGRPRWSFALPPSQGIGFSVAVVASNARQTVLASGGFLGGGSSAGGTFTPFGPTTLVSVDTRTGRERHRTVVADPELTFSKGVLHQNVLALINGREINGIDLTSGQIAWRYPLPPPSSNYRGVLSGGLHGAVAIYSSPLTKATVALDTITGATRWSRPTLGMVGQGGDAATIVLLAPLRTFTQEPVEGVDIATGRTRWTRTLRSTYAVPEPLLRQPRYAAMSVGCATP